MLSLIWRFSRPHTLIGSSISIVSLLFLVVFCSSHGGSQGMHIFNDSHHISQSAKVVGFIPVVTATASGFFNTLLPTLFVCLACNIFITGLNQIVDVELDKINKPQLPLASGELTISQGKWIVGIAGSIAIFGAWLIQPFLRISHYRHCRNWGDVFVAAHSVQTTSRLGRFRHRTGSRPTYQRRNCHSFRHRFVWMACDLTNLAYTPCGVCYCI